VTTGRHGAASCGNVTAGRVGEVSAATRGASWRLPSPAGRARSTRRPRRQRHHLGPLSATGASDARSTPASARATSSLRRHESRRCTLEPLRTRRRQPRRPPDPPPRTTSHSGGPRLGYVPYDRRRARGTLIVTSSKDSYGLATRARAYPRDLARTSRSVFGPTTSADGRLLATNGLDQTLRLWDAVAARPLGPPITSPAATVRSAISPDGRNRRSVRGPARCRGCLRHHSRRHSPDCASTTAPVVLSLSRDGRLLDRQQRRPRPRLSGARLASPGPGIPGCRGPSAAWTPVPDDRNRDVRRRRPDRLWTSRAAGRFGAPLRAGEHRGRRTLRARGNHGLRDLHSGRGYRWTPASAWNDQACAVRRAAQPRQSARAAPGPGLRRRACYAA